MLSSSAPENPLHITTSMQHPQFRAIPSSTKELNSHTACLFPSLWSTSSQCVHYQCVVCRCVWSMIVLVHWETLLNERVPQASRTLSQVLLCCTLCVHGHKLHTHPSACPCLSLEFAPTNRPLNLTHIQHIQTYKQPEPPGVAPLLAATECVSRHNSNRTTFESSPILRKPVGFPGANEMPARQMDMREPQSDPTLGSK